MQLERIALHLRPRSTWEALDLGLAMSAAWRGPALRAWLASYWLAGLVLLTVLHAHLEIALLLLWWLKPVFDRVLLHGYSRALFGESMSTRDALRAIPRLLRDPGVLSALTLRRFSMARSFLLPVWQLEQQRGAEARQRFRLLAARQRGQAAWLTFFCANASTILWVSGVIVLQMLVPEGYTLFETSQWLNNDQPGYAKFISALLYMSAESLIEPYYVAAGFALYLNRRSELEGWDIELAFRRLSARKAAEASNAIPVGKAVVMLMFGLAALLMIAPQPSQAAADDDTTDAPAAAVAPAQPSTAKPPPSRARREIDAVLADPVFGKQLADTRWQWIDDAKARPALGMPGWFKALRALINGLSAVLKILVALLALAALAALLWLVWRTRDRWQATTQRAPAPHILFGLDVRPASLPADIAGTALAESDPARALSLLYRGALVALIHHHQAEFRQGDTEADCLQRSRPHLPDSGQHYFARLLDAWRLTAYAATPPTAAELRALCLDWPRHFANSGASPS